MDNINRSITFEFYNGIEGMESEFPIHKWIANQTNRPVYRTRTFNDDCMIPVDAVTAFIESLPNKSVYRLYDANIDWQTDKKYKIIWHINEDVEFFSNNVTLIEMEYIEENKFISNLNIYSTIKDVDVFNKKYDDPFINMKKLNEPKENKIHLITQGMGGWITREMDIIKTNVDVELNYGSKFVDVNDKIIETLNEDKGKGLVLLHGMPGTGKTHYLRYLTQKINSKRIIFIPPHMAEFITSPDAMSFLIERRNSVLFIEDAEKIIMSREDGGSQGVSNLLNMTDGILSDVLNIQVVATFNVSIDKIDEALLRKGRLVAQHYFGKLSVDDSNNLLKHLGKDYRTEVEMSLSEIYSCDEETFSHTKEDVKIGF